MVEFQRHASILETLQSKGSITIEDIVTEFNVSSATARRDLTKLDTQNKLQKIRNGAKIANSSKIKWSPLNIHEANNYNEKISIAQAAANLCAPNDSVIINCGSTAFLLGQQICGNDIQVITNYYPLVNYLIEENHDNLIVIGGQYYKHCDLFLTAEANNDFAFSGNYMFTSGSSLSTDGLFKVDVLSIVAEQKMIANVHKVVALVDSLKVGNRLGTLFAPIKQLDIVITGKSACADTIKFLRDEGVEVILV